MDDSPRRYQAGYLEPTTQDWVPGLPAEDAAVDVGYFDLELEVWALGEPDILSGAWMPNDALLAMGADCPSDHPIKGNLPSRIYHRPDQATYDRTDPEICFASEDAAMLAGFRASRAPQSAR
jgi:hypothetical protein